MDFMEKVGDSIVTTGRAVTEKAKDLAEIANLKGKIHACEEDIRKNYIELGKLYFEAHGQEPEAGYDGFCWAIADAKESIEEMEEKIRCIKGI